MATRAQYGSSAAALSSAAERLGVPCSAAEKQATLSPADYAYPALSPAALARLREQLAATGVGRALEGARGLGGSLGGGARRARGPAIACSQPRSAIGGPTNGRRGRARY